MPTDRELQTQPDAGRAAPAADTSDAQSNIGAPNTPPATSGEISGAAPGKSSDTTACGAPLSLSKVVKRYADGRAVLDGLDLEVAAGEFVVVLGRSGSGKSTLLNLIAGIDVPDSGRVEVAGSDLARMSDAGRTRFRRDRIGLVFQAFNLVPTLSVLQNLCLPLELCGRSNEAKTLAERMLERLGLAGRGSEAPESLSGGEQQRVAVGRALIHSPALILADEPTGALDLETARVVVELLDSMVRDNGSTLVMVTHAPEVVGVADRLLTLNAGRVVEHPA